MKKTRHPVAKNWLLKNNITLKYTVKYFNNMEPEINIWKGLCRWFFLKELDCNLLNLTTANVCEKIHRKNYFVSAVSHEIEDHGSPTAKHSTKSLK